ncbi:MAG: VOC family protein [Acidobacteriota bacterium]
MEACLYVDDVFAAERFYRDVLGLTAFSKPTQRDLFFRCGDGMFLVFDANRTRIEDSEVPSHGAFGPGHIAFAIAGDRVDAWRNRLLDHGVVIEREINWPGGGRSLYFRDPAGNSVELATPKLWGLEA